MPISDYAHHNEEAPRIWWEEEGRHADEREPMDDDDREQSYGAADAFAEELAEYEDEALFALLADEEYHARWPKARSIIEDEVRDRGSVLVNEAKRQGLMQ